MFSIRLVYGVKDTYPYVKKLYIHQKKSFLILNISTAAVYFYKRGIEFV